MLKRAMAIAPVTVMAVLATASQASAAIVQGTVTPFSATSPLPIVNLLTLGTDDWAQWSYGTSGSVTGVPSASKAGASIISNALAVTSNVVGDSSNLRAIAGTSQRFIGSTDGKDWLNNGVTNSTVNVNGNGVAFTITGQVDRTYTVSVFVGGYNGTGTLNATLNGDVVYTDSSVVYGVQANPKAGALYTLTFTPQEADSVLTISYVVSPAAGGSSHVLLQNVAVSSAPVPEAASISLLAIGMATQFRRKS